MTNIFIEYKKLVAQFVSFKSISTDSKYLSEIEKTVSWLKNLFTGNNFKVEIWKSKLANPVVFAELAFDKSLPTVLIYGHYDVQPADKKDGWKSEPFTLAFGSKKLFARGIIDNKGQVLIHIVSVFELAKKGLLKYNVKFILEGNEETGSTPWKQILGNNRKKLACDFVIVSDGELTNNKPTIEVSLRGGFNCTLNYVTGKNNLHSGLAGGAAPSAAYEMAKFLSKLYTAENTISFPEFYKDVDKISTAQLNNNKYLARSAKNITKLMGVKSLLMEKGRDFFTQTGLRPTIQITGLKTGYIDTGYSNIIPATAEARLNFRLVASQKPEKVFADFKKFVAKNTPSYVEFSITYSGFHAPVKIDDTNKYVRNAEKILSKVYGTRVNRRNVGGAIPFVGDVKTILGVDTILIPLVNEDCNMHGANENFDIKLAQKALKFSYDFLSS